MSLQNACYHVKEHKKLGQKLVSKVTLNFVWGHLPKKQTVKPLPPWLIVIKLECWKCLVSGSTIVMMRRTWWICRRSFTPSATTWTTGRNFSTKVQPHLPFKFELTFIQNCLAERTGSWSMKVNLNVSGSPMFKNYGWSVVIGLVIHIMTWKSFMRLSHDFFGHYW